MSTRRKLVETDVDTDEAPVDEDVRRCSVAVGSGSPSPDSVCRSSISFKPKEPTLSSLVVVVGRATRADDRLVPTTPKDEVTKAGRRQIGAQRGAMVSGGAAGEGEEHSSREDLSWLYGEADAVDAERKTAEQDVVVEDKISDRTTSAVTKRRVQRGALSVITTQMTISTRKDPVPVQEETDPEVTFKTLPRTTDVVAKPSSRITVTRGGIAMASRRVTDWAQSQDIGLNTPTSSPIFGRGACTPTISRRGAMALSGSGRGIMRLDDPGYFRVRRDEPATPGRSGRSSRASVDPWTWRSWKTDCGKR